jgi:hypothetical protein
MELFDFNRGGGGTCSNGWARFGNEVQEWMGSRLFVIDGSSLKLCLSHFLFRGTELVYRARDFFYKNKKP